MKMKIVLKFLESLFTWRKSWYIIDFVVLLRIQRENNRAYLNNGGFKNEKCASLLFWA